MVQGALNLIPEVPIHRLVELAQYAESVGYQRCWVYDEGLAARDVYVTLTAIAVATNRIELGPGITNPYTRHMSSTAGAVAALDELSGGRAFLGVGAGGSLTLDPVGIDRHRPLVAVGELIEVCRGLFSAQPVDHRGEFTELRNATIAYARPSTEIWLAGRGPKMLALGATRCDGVMLDFIYKPNLGPILERVRRAGVDAGRAPRISYSTLVVADDATMAVARRHMTYRLVDSPAEVKQAIGMSDADATRMRAALADGLDAAAEQVRDEWVHPFVISGTVDACTSELGDLGERYGIDEFLVPVLDDRGAEQVLQVVAAALGL